MDQDRLELMIKEDYSIDDILEESKRLDEVVIMKLTDGLTDG